MQVGTREAGARLEREQRVAAGVAPPQPVYDDLPNLGFRNVVVVDRPPALDVLIPGLQMQHLSSGPNTALNLTYRVAAASVSVRYCSTDLPHDDEEALRRHCAGLTGVAERLPNVQVAGMHDRGTPTPVGRRDMLYSTSWWTAQYAQHMLGRTQRDAFFYMIQDLEPGSARNSPGCVMSSPGCGAASPGAPPPPSGPWAARCAARSSARGQIDLSDDSELRQQGCCPPTQPPLPLGSLQSVLATWIRFAGGLLEALSRISFFRGDPTSSGCTQIGERSMRAFEIFGDCPIILAADDLEDRGAQG